jgi:hypothetical protein
MLPDSAPSDVKKAMQEFKRCGAWVEVAHRWMSGGATKPHGASDCGSLVLPSPLYLRRVKNEGGHFGSHSPLTCHRFLLRYNRGRLRVGVIDWSGIR